MIKPWKRNKSLDDRFIIISAASLFLTALVLFVTRGECFNQIFFHDSLDSGMDFFHSIEYTLGRSPYALFGTLYPPLANLFFYFFIRFVPSWQWEMWAPTFSEGVAARGTEADLRHWQPTFIIFIVFVVITTMMLIMLVTEYLPEMKRSRRNMICLFSLLSSGVLYSYERGNIMILAALCVMFFALYYDSDSRVLSELSLIALAIGAGLKIFPAVFGMILIYDKQYKKAIRCVAYGMFFFVAPSLIFKEGIGGIRFFMDILARHSDYSLSNSGFSFGSFVNTIAIILHFGIDNIQDISFLEFIASKGAIVVSLLMLFCGFFMRKRWEKTLVCCVSMLAFQAQGNYALTFFLIPLLFMFNEERKINRRNKIPYYALVLMTVMLPVIDIRDFDISFQSVRYQICMLVLVVYLVWLAGKRMVRRIKHKLSI